MFRICTAWIAAVWVFAAAPPTAEQVREAIETYDRLTSGPEPSTASQQRAAADEALAGIDFATIGLDLLERLLSGSGACYRTSRRDEVDAGLSRLGAAPTARGARALVYRLGFTEAAPVDRQREIIATMLEHPGLAEALADGGLWPQFLNFAWYIEPEALTGLERRLIALGEHLPARTPMLGVLGAVDLFDAVAAADPDGYERREPLRAAVVAALRRAEEYVDPKDPELRNWNFARDIPGKIRHEIARLEGPAVRGPLVGRPAPEVEFIWVSGGRELSKLSELRGRIVVMDFWTTWCGPCVAAFPRIRQLVERYAGHPVEVIGVTSIQGGHFGIDGHIDCRGDPEREIALMEGFLEWRGVTWTVAFSKHGVFNPLYNVGAIPHVVIVDAGGRVRARGLHPARHHQRLIERIDELLVEMGRRPPPAPDPDDDPAPGGTPQGGGPGAGAGPAGGSIP